MSSLIKGSDHRAFFKDIALIVLFGLHGWPLIFKMPFTIWSVIQAFRPNGCGISERSFWAFGLNDVRFRPFYNKIARDFRTQGRFGFAWDDGLGMPLGDRIYNNLATYWLLDKLGTRRMMGLGYILMLVFSGLTIDLAFGHWITGVAILFIAASPIIVSSYTHAGKPEMFWWPLAIPMATAVFSGFGLLAGLIWSLIALVNFSVSILTMLILGISIILFMIPSQEFFWFLLGSLPGVIKYGLRVTHMVRTGFLQNLAAEQSRLWKRPWYPIKTELMVWIPFASMILVTAWDSQIYLLGIVLLFSGIGIFWANYRIIYFADPGSILACFWIIGLSFAVVAQSGIGLIFNIIFLYTHPIFCKFPISSRTKNNGAQVDRIKYIRKVYLENICNYPNLKLLALTEQDLLMKFFDNIPSGSRILAESDGDPRTESGFRAFWQWTEEYLPLRLIDLVNEMYTRAVEPELVDAYLNKFNSHYFTSHEMDDLCRTIGVSHVVAYTPDMTGSLTHVGWKMISQIDLSLLDGLLQALKSRTSKLFLLEAPYPNSVIEPYTVWHRVGNELSWEGEKDVTYTIRYRYHNNFAAYQDGRELSVRPIFPFKDIQLQFIQVVAPSYGRISLKYKKTFL